MPKFGKLLTDEVLIQGDKVCLNCAASFATPDEEGELAFSIKADADSDFIEAYEGKLNWLYSTAGDKTVTVKVSNTTGDQEFEFPVTVVTLASLKLFSTDAELIQYEPNIFDYMQFRWSSFNLFHFRAQKTILNWLDEKRIWNQEGEKLTPAAILDMTEVRDLSAALALQYIFESSTTQVGDIYSTKATLYQGEVSKRMQKATLRLDVNGDSVEDKVDDLSIRLVRG